MNLIRSHSLFISDDHAVDRYLVSELPHVVKDSREGVGIVIDQSDRASIFEQNEAGVRGCEEAARSGETVNEAKGSPHQ